MIAYGEALSLLRALAAVRKLGTETVELERCVGRVLAGPVASGSEFVPPFDNSAMDGFAVCAAATSEASVAQTLRLPVMACIVAGDRPPAEPPRRSEAVEIMTGAPMPGGALDAVIKIEDVRVVRDSDGTAREIEILRPAKAGENVRRQGEDYRPGTELLGAHTRLLPTHLLGLATVGHDRIAVKRKPRVVVISTGRELAPHTIRTLEPGQIRNSTGPFLVAGLEELGAEARYLGVVADEPRRFEALLSSLLDDPPNLILTTGAVSMGKHDFIADSLANLGWQILAQKVAIRPGKPLLIAEWEKGKTRPVFMGLPGNPISTAVGLRFFVEPFLRALTGLQTESPLWLPLAADTSKPEGLRCFFKARMEFGASSFSVRSLPGQASFMVHPLLEANGWVVLPEEGRQHSKGTWVEVYHLQPTWSGMGVRDEPGDMPARAKDH
jgi:molybdopterin molybdotransferase